MANMFRPLRADEIDVRVGIVREKGISLLLYKDARCDMAILDETVGPYNWQRTHSRENANCVVEIWDDGKKQWIGKEDTGTESNTEAEKGLASDSFKRACVNWGIGRELYTAPFVWLKAAADTSVDDLKRDYYTVTAIGYDERGNINRLKIESDKTGKAVFDYSTRIEDMIGQGAEEEPIQGAAGLGVKIFDATAAIKAYCEEHGLTKTEFIRRRRELINADRIPEIKYDVLDEQGYRQLIEAIEAADYE